VRIGKPLSGYSAHVVGAGGSSITDGASGELRIGGEGVAAGYWNRPELNAEKFVTQAWASGDRLYRTGDLVFRDADGSFRFLGRIDDQVKLPARAPRGTW
jgi:non-ribosomal peptide synthetase component F